MFKKRVTVEEGLEAYRETGLKPVLKSWGTEQIPWKGCGMAAMAALAGARIGDRRDTAMVIYGWEYVYGFMSGFDGSISDPPLRARGRKRYLDGYEDGEALAKAIFEDKALEETDWDAELAGLKTEVLVNA